MDNGWRVDAIDPGLKYRHEWIDAGYALPAKFSVLASREELEAKVDVRIADGRAIVAGLHITSGAAGVTTTELRSIPLREIVAYGARMLLSHGAPGSPMASELKHDERSLAAIRKAVGYVAVPS
jgi:hypothetical protein